MSVVTYTTGCRDCVVLAPRIGYWGYMGMPSLTAERWDPEDVQFGQLFEAFVAIGLVTDELSDLADFLGQHAGHQTETWADNDSAPSEFQQAWPDGEPDTPGVWSRTVAERAARPGFVHASYRLGCTCGAESASP